MYDLFVNLSSSTITVAEHAKGMFSLSKAHKEIAKLMMEAAKDPEKSDQQAIKEINLKTKELIGNLKGLSVKEDGTPGVISYELLKQRKFTANMSNFLFALATAEGADTALTVLKCILCFELISVYFVVYLAIIWFVCFLLRRV